MAPDFLRRWVLNVTVGGAQGVLVGILAAVVMAAVRAVVTGVVMRSLLRAGGAPPTSRTQVKEPMNPAAIRSPMGATTEGASRWTATRCTFRAWAD